MADLKILLPLAIISCFKSVYGDIINRENFSYEIVHGTEELGWGFRGSMDAIFKDIYFTKLCENDIRTSVVGHNYGLILKADSNQKAAFKVDLGTSRTIASFFLLNPVFNDWSSGYYPLT